MGRASTSRHERDNDATRSPLWPVALILGEIAERIERDRLGSPPTVASTDSVRPRRGV